MTPRSNTLIDLTRAYHFAAERHVDQRRKGEAAEPYVNHLTEVAELTARAVEDDAIAVVIAAVLHDVIEDTDTTAPDIASAFGSDVADYVAEVTDDTRLPKAERKRLQIEHAPKASHGAKIIKLADKTSNLRAMLNSPPAGWPRSRIVEYLNWSRAVVAGCRGTSSWLEEQFDRAAQALEASLACAASSGEKR